MLPIKRITLIDNMPSINFFFLAIVLLFLTTPPDSFNYSSNF